MKIVSYFILFGYLMECALALSLNDTSSWFKTLPEVRLMDDLFRDYDPAYRPRRNPLETVNVKVNFFLVAIQAVNEKDLTITLGGFLSLSWKDDFVKWDPRAYGGVTMLVVPVRKIWTPDIIFDNSVNERFFDSRYFHARVYYDGRVNWEPGGSMRLYCDYDLSYYPYDIQDCKISIVTWANTGRQVYSYAGNASSEYYRENGEWNLRELKMQNYTLNMDNEEYSEVHMSLVMNRKPLFQILNIIFPMILLSIISIFVFCVPSESGEKVSLAVTILLSFSVWLLIMQQLMPSTSDYIPIIGAYIAIFMVVSTIATISAVTVLNLTYQPDTKPIPVLVVKMFRFLPGSKWAQTDSTCPTLTWKAVAETLDKALLYFFLSLITVLTLAVIIFLQLHRK